MEDFTMTESEEHQQDVIMIPTSPTKVSTLQTDSNGGGSDEEKKENPKTSEIKICPICFLVLASVGQHQICCLPCGHIYGLSCIKKWLLRQSGSRKCPQCNRLCKLKDVRVLYASRLCVVNEDYHMVQPPLEKIKEYLKEEVTKEVNEEMQVQLNEIGLQIENMNKEIGDEMRVHREDIVKLLEEMKVEYEKLPKEIRAQLKP